MNKDLAFAARVRHAEPVMGTVVSFDVPVTARHGGSFGSVRTRGSCGPMPGRAGTGTS